MSDLLRHRERNGEDAAKIYEQGGSQKGDKINFLSPFFLDSAVALIGVLTSSPPRNLESKDKMTSALLLSIDHVR